jgi:predicted alpha/beta hydrolase family esterase
MKCDQCIIIHGCPPSKDNVLPKEKRWMNWLEKELKKKDLRAVAPDMPTPWAPVYTEWKCVFEKLPVTEMSCLVGHSCGAAFLVRWLLETKHHVRKLILVAPAKTPETHGDTRQDLYKFKLPSDASSIADEIVLFISNDFPHHMKSFELYKNALKPRIITLKNKGHFLIFTMGTIEFPELLEEIVQ